MFTNDLEGALAHYEWFEETFPFDIGYSMHLLCWTLALYRSNDREAVPHKLRQTMLSNLYLIPHLLELEQADLDIWHGSNIAERLHLKCIPEEVFDLWDEEALQWLDDTYHSDTESWIFRLPAGSHDAAHPAPDGNHLPDPRVKQSLPGKTNCLRGFL